MKRKARVYHGIAKASMGASRPFSRVSRWAWRRMFMADPSLDRPLRTPEELELFDLMERMEAKRKAA